jgi:RNA recognition motif-containing protein
LTDDVLKAFASKAGNVTSVDFAPRRRHAYVTYRDEASAQKAISTINGQTLEDRAVRVESSKPPKPESSPAAAGAGAARSSEPAERKIVKNRIVVRGLPETFNSAALEVAFSSE